MAESPVPDTRYFFFHLGLTGGTLAILGLFSFGVGLYLQDVSMHNKRIALGCLLFFLGNAVGVIHRLRQKRSRIRYEFVSLVIWLSGVILSTWWLTVLFNKA